MKCDRCRKEIKTKLGDIFYVLTQRRMVNGSHSGLYSEKASEKYLCSAKCLLEESTEVERQTL
jgi:hypothetical protein